jgi:ABC-type multidrug transport system ATPase subunit
VVSDRYVLRAEGIGKSFGKTQALKAASVWAEPGKVTTLMGRNGSGKTTLLRIAAGVLGADYGMVSFRGDARERHSLAQLARQGLMYLPQDRLVAPNYRVQAHFDALGAVYGSRWVEQAIDVVGISHLLEQRCATLSGGERTRVSLALAFARRPKVLIADEPLVGLTPRDQERLGGKLVEIAALGVAVVTSGHDVRALFDISDAIIWSVAGTTHHLGGVTSALAHEQFRREYLGPGWQ